VPFRGVFFVKNPRRHPPHWLPLVEEGVAGNLGALESSSPSGVLFLRSSKRLFALTFGYGRALLDPDTYETDFGLRVALNVVDPSQLRSIDVRTMEEMTLHTRRQASRSSPLENFGLDITRDLLRAVTGKPRNPALASRIAGADSLTLACPIRFGDLGMKCSELLTAYRARTYREYFPWIDRLALVRDPAVRTVLDAKLIEGLRQRQTDRVYLAVPELIDWQRFAGVRYSTEGRNRPFHADVDIDDYLGTIADRDDLSIDDLHKHTVRTVRVDGGEGDEHWTVYRCVVFEVHWKGLLYALADGQWYRIAHGFAEEVHTAVANLSPPTFTLPDARAGEIEATYNARTAAGNNHVALMDSQLVRNGTGRDGVEVCDLFSDQRHFIHVKRKTRSSTLSHLFVQGAVSAELFLGEGRFRTGFRGKLTEVKPALAPLIPVGDPNPRDYEIMYAIIAKSAAGIPTSLPFFSQLHLTQVARRLRLLGYKVSVRGVQER
jgi:uncharacterized protein (TIGR04141 family)